MIIKQKLVEPMNAQIQSEFAASAQYVAIAVYFDDQSLPELADFFYQQSEEEREHAMKFVHFMLDAGVKPTIPSLPQLQNDFQQSSRKLAAEFSIERMVEQTVSIYRQLLLGKSQAVTAVCQHANLATSARDAGG